MSEKHEIRLNEYWRVWYNRLPAEVRAVATAEAASRRPRGPLPLIAEREYIGRPRIMFFDLATSYALADEGVKVGWTLVLNTGQRIDRVKPPNWQNAYIEWDNETAFPVGPELSRIRADYLRNDPFGFSEATPSARRVYNCWPLTHYNTGQLFLDAYFYNEATRRRYVLQDGNPAWAERRPAAERLDSFTREVKPRFTNSVSRQAAAVLEAELGNERNETWLNHELAMVNNEGILIPNAGAGLYDFELVSPYYYEPFNTRDTITYKVTAAPDFNEPETSMPKIRFGDRNSQSVRVFMVPQYWHMSARYFAWYLFVTFWAFTYLRIPNVISFYNRFPLFPRPFELGSTDYPPIWQWVERSKAHQRAVAQDLAIQFFSPFIAMIFIFTSDGFYEIRQFNTFAGQLVAVVEIYGKPYYIWRKLATNRDLTLQLSAGPLNTYWINSFGTTIIGTQVF